MEWVAKQNSEWLDKIDGIIWFNEFLFCEYRFFLPDRDS